MTPTSRAAALFRTKPKAKLAELQVWIEADLKHAHMQLKSSPMWPGTSELSMPSRSSRKRVIKNQLHDVQDPDEQPRNKALRSSRLRIEEKEFREQLREACVEMGEANASAKELRAKIHARLAEIEQLRSEQRLLALASMGQHTTTPGCYRSGC